MDSTLVIKVKYGDTLRRFNARVDIDDTLDLDMAGLRAKIISLFDLQPDAELTVTYVDEDGDVVTLVDDNDLHDVMKQRLKFLRIDVQLNNDKGGNSSARSSGISTPLRSPRVLYPVPTINVAEVLKSVPQPLQPLREAISKLSLDVASKAASGPVLGEVVDLLYKIGQAYGNLGSLPNVGAGSNPQNVAGPSNLSKDGGMSEVMPVSESFAPASKDSRDALTGNVTDSVGAPAARNPTPVDLNLPPGDSNPSTAVAVAPVPLDVPAGDKGNDTKEDSNGRKSSGCHVSGRTLVPTMFETDITGIPFNECPFTGTSVGNDSAMPYFGFDPNHPSKKSCSRTASMGGMFHKGVQCDGCGVYPITGPRYKSKVKEDYDLCSICFSELGNEKDYIKMDRPVSFSHPRVKCGARSFKGSEDQMKGPWFRPPGLAHHMKENLQMKGPWVRGSVLTREHNFNSENPHMNPSWVRASVLTREHNFSRGCGTKLSRPKLDSRFILDVNVIDGTMMAPATPFTKIWRMRNSGSLIWPRGSQLVWIGGDRYSDAVSVEIEIPENGLPVDRELDIAVDFTAPASPGRYISYWKMASPSGQKFGQRVWVLIQVDASSEDSLYDSLEGLNLNLPLGCEDPEITDVNVQSDGEPGSSNMASEPVKPVVDELPKKDNDLNFPINDTLLVGHGISSSATPEAVSYPIVDDSEALLAALAPAPFNVAVAPSHDDSEALLAALTPAPFNVAVAPSHGPFPAPVAPDHGSTKVVDGSTSAQVVTTKNAVEEALLKDLEEMGFKQVDLNKEVLRMNEYNLEQSVDHLCGVDEWDPILEELHEMGFHDNETNKRLLVKNNGSIKRVVMDLITGEKAFS